MLRRREGQPAWSDGYLRLGWWGGAPIRLHWSLPLGLAFFTGGELAPGAWLGFVVVVLVHEAGHAFLVEQAGHRVVSIDVHGVGGVCQWAGRSAELDRVFIAWGGVLAQLALLLVAEGVFRHLHGYRGSFLGDLYGALVPSNLWMIGLNLLPVPPLDGARAWAILPIAYDGLRARLARRAGASVPKRRGRGWSADDAPP